MGAKRRGRGMMDVAEEDRREQVLQALPQAEETLKELDEAGKKLAEALAEKMVQMEARYSQANRGTEELLRISSDAAEAVREVCVRSDEQSSKILIEMDLLEHELGRLEHVAEKVQSLHKLTKALEAVADSL